MKEIFGKEYNKLDFNTSAVSTFLMMIWGEGDFERMHRVVDLK